MVSNESLLFGGRREGEGIGSTENIGLIWGHP